MSNRQEPDTHCSRCGGALVPVPSFTLMKWECPCQAPNLDFKMPVRRSGRLVELLRGRPYPNFPMKVWPKFEVLMPGSCPITIEGWDASRDVFYGNYTGGVLSGLSWELPFISNDVFDLVE